MSACWRCQIYARAFEEATWYIGPHAELQFRTYSLRGYVLDDIPESQASPEPEASTLELLLVAFSKKFHPNLKAK